MNNALVDRIDTIDELETTYDAVRFSRDLGAEIGAERFSIMTLDDTCERVCELALVTNWEPALISLYDEEKLSNGSPILNHCRENDRPLLYAIDTLTQERDERKQALAVALFNDFGMGRGVTYPVGNRSGQRGSITFSGRRITLGRPEVFSLHLICNYLFERLSKLSSYPDTNANRHPLTPMEIDCLRWTAYGKTSKEIACILSLSDNAVVHRLANVCRKLNATNRVHAVAIALRERLLD